jgi:hypothetical protein
MPTPRPIIVARVEATLGTWITPSSKRMIESAQARPITAEKIGSIIAVAVPKARRRMITAAVRPTASLISVEGLESAWPT